MPTLTSRDSITCRLCGEEYRSITFSHLHRVHRFRGTHPVLDYKRRFGLRWAACWNTRDKVRQAKFAYYEGEGRRWTRERILGAIRSRHQRGHDLGPTRVGDLDRSLYQAARRVLGSWRAALQAAGLDPAHHFVHPAPLSRTQLLREIRGAFRRGELRRGMRSKAANQRLVQAAFRIHGSWLGALREAGVPRAYRPTVRWTKGEVASRIRKRIRKGRSILGKDIQQEERRLYVFAVRLFRMPWADVIDALGVRYPGRRTWTREKVVREIRRLKRRGRPLNRDFVERRVDASLVHVAVRRFGNWDRALKAAGLDPTRIRKGFRHI